MAQITAQCPHCKQQFTAQTEWIGQQTNCPACGNLFTICDPAAASRAESVGTFMVQCPHCKQQFTAQTEWIGQQANCPTCGNLFTICDPAAASKAESLGTFMAQCPHCKQQFTAQTEWIGQSVTCPGCRNNFIITKTVSKKNFLEIIKGSQSLLPDVIVLGIIFLSLFIYVIGVICGISNCNDKITSLMGYSIFSPWDILCFNVPLEAGIYELFGVMRVDILPNVILIIFFVISVFHLILALVNKTIFRKIQIFASSICLVFVLVIFMIIDSCDLGLYAILGNLNAYYDGTFSICYTYSTIFYTLVLALGIISGSIWLKYKAYLKAYSNGEQINFMDFIKKHLKWEIL